MAEGYMQGDKDTGVTVPFSDDEAEPKDVAELVADDDKGATPQEAISRKQKRQERLTKLLQEGKQSKEEVASLRSEQAELKAQLARLEGYVAASSQQSRPANDVDPYKARLEQIETRRKEAWASAQAELKAGTMDEKRQAYYEGVSREIEEAKGEVFADRAIARREPAQRQDSARQQWVNQYPEVYRNENAFKYAQARAQMRQADGEQLTEEVTHDILQEARTRFKLGPKKAPTVSERDRFSGMASSGNGGGGGSGDTGIVMKPEYRKMATALYSDLPEKEAIKKWVNGPGKKLRQAKVI